MPNPAKERMMTRTALRSELIEAKITAVVRTQTAEQAVRYGAGTVRRGHSAG